MLYTITRHLDPSMMRCLLNTACFTIAVALLLENKHKYLVKGDIIKYEKTLQACYCGFLIHLIYLRGWGDRNLAQVFSIFNDIFKTMLVTKLQVLLGGSNVKHI
jgi:hypothetical protein